MIRLSLPLTTLMAAMALGACSREEATRPPSPPPPGESGIVHPAPPPTTPQRAAPKPVQAGLPRTGPDRYVGRWAASTSLCRNGAWRFQPLALSTAGETACRFETATERDGGYDLVGTCLQQGASKPAKLRLTFAQSAGAMLVEGPPFQSTALIWCGETPAAATTP